MANNVLDSYLVKLGAVADTPSWNKFSLTLRDAEKAVVSFTGSTALNFLKIEGTIVGVLSTVGTGLIALADRTAMADQQYRLFGMRMLMTKESARALSQVQDELGASLDEIAFDPELNKRAQYLYEQNIKLGKEMGTGFDDNMIKLRDIRMEYGRLKVELDDLSGGTINKLFEKLGYGNGQLETQLHNINNELSEKLPKIADEISDDLIPVWKDWVVVTKDLGSMLKTAAGDWTFLTGVMTGDKSIESTEFNFKNLLKATVDWFDVLTEAALALQLIGKEGMHMGTAVAAGFGVIKAAIQGNWGEVTRLTKIQDTEIKAAAVNFQDLFDPGKNGEYLRKNKDFAAIVAHEDEKAGRGKKADSAGTPQSNTTANQIVSAAQMVSKDTGIPASFIYGQWAQETDHFKSRVFKDLHNMGGIKIPGTNTYENYDSIDSFAKAYEKVLKENRYTSRGIMDARTPEDFVHSLKGEKGQQAYFADNEDTYRRRVSQFSREYNSAQGSDGQVVIENLHINVPHALPEHQWSDFVKQSMTDITNKDTRNTTAQTAAGAFF